ncbi:MAG: carboxypeptidase-like regulatory domain-containing protein [Bryobacteraceae bacterium]
MRTPLLLFLLTAAAFAIDGTVINRTTGKPQQGATVTLYRMGADGLDSVESVQTDAAGKFVINYTIEGPRLLQAAFDGVTYNHMLPPRAPSTNVQVQVYNASKQPGSAVVTQHMVLLEPSDKELSVRESFVWENTGKTSYNDPDGGTLKIYVPKAAIKSLQVNGTAPQGMPIRRAPEPAGQPDVYKIDFPIKPGESNIQLDYSLPFTTPGTFESRVFYKNGGPTSIVAPPGVEIKGEGVELKSREPRTQATIYQTTAASYKVEVSGAGMLRRSQPAEPDEQQGPQISQILPRLYNRMYWILGLAFGILALGFTILYRSAAPAKAKK